MKHDALNTINVKNSYIFLLLMCFYMYENDLGSLWIVFLCLCRGHINILQISKIYMFIIYRDISINVCLNTWDIFVICCFVLHITVCNCCFNKFFLFFYDQYFYRVEVFTVWLKKKRQHVHTETWGHSPTKRKGFSWRWRGGMLLVPGGMMLIL